MKNLFLFSFLLLIVSCSKPDVKPDIFIDCSSDPQVCSISEANNTFGINIFKELNQKQSADNIFISPTSIGTALTMAANGAKNNTLTQMLSTLEIDNISMDDMNLGYKRLLEVFPEMDQKVNLKLANSIWPSKGFSIKQSFIDINKNSFLSEVNAVDFSDVNTVSTINNWIENHTEGLIKNTISSLSANTIMVLVNTIYFKADWKTVFKKEDTFNTNFHNEEGDVISQADMMHLAKSKFFHMQNEMMDLVDLPYGNETFAMSIIVPRDAYGVNDIITELSNDSWNDWRSKLYERDIELFLPKFKMKYKKELQDELSTLGMVDAFSPNNADFRDIADAGLYISKVIHQSFIEVDEKGTEAAAATVVVFDTTSSGTNPVVNANKPFLFVIHEKNTGSILFIGKMMNPK